MPLIYPSIRRQPFNAIGLARIIPVLRAIMFGVYWKNELGGILPPAEGAILLDVIQLKSLDPLPVDSVAHVSSNHGNITKGFSPRITIHHNVGPYHKRWVNSYSYPIRRRNDPYLDRVQCDVATLEGEKQEEAHRDYGQQREINSHSYHLSMRIASSRRDVKRIAWRAELDQKNPEVIAIE